MEEEERQACEELRRGGRTRGRPVESCPRCGCAGCSWLSLSPLAYKTSRAVRSLLRSPEPLGARRLMPQQRAEEGIAMSNFDSKYRPPSDSSRENVVDHHAPNGEPPTLVYISTPHHGMGPLLPSFSSPLPVWPAHSPCPTAPLTPQSQTTTTRQARARGRARSPTESTSSRSNRLSAARCRCVYRPYG